MLLRDVLYKVAIRTVVGSTDIEVKNIQINSKKVEPGDVFTAIKGTVTDGHQFIEKAVENGAASVVCEAMERRR